MPSTTLDAWCSLPHRLFSSHYPICVLASGHALQPAHHSLSRWRRPRCPACPLAYPCSRPWLQWHWQNIGGRRGRCKVHNKRAGRWCFLQRPAGQHACQPRLHLRTPFLNSPVLTGNALLRHPKALLQAHQRLCPQRLAPQPIKAAPALAWALGGGRASRLALAQPSRGGGRQLISRCCIAALHQPRLAAAPASRRSVCLGQQAHGEGVQVGAQVALRLLRRVAERMVRAGRADGASPNHSRFACSPGTRAAPGCGARAARGAPAGRSARSPPGAA